MRRPRPPTTSRPSCLWLGHESTKSTEVYLHLSTPRSNRKPSTRSPRSTRRPVATSPPISCSRSWKACEPGSSCRTARAPRHPQPEGRCRAGHNGPSERGTSRCSCGRARPAANDLVPELRAARHVCSTSPRCIAAESTANPIFGIVRRTAAIARSPERIVITRILSARAFARISLATAQDQHPPASRPPRDEQLRVVAAGSVEGIIRDPAKLLVMSRLHAASSRWLRVDGGDRWIASQPARLPRCSALWVG